MAVAPRQVPLGLRIGITVLLLGLYWFGARVPLPFLHLERVPELGSSAASLGRASVTALGVTTLITGFLIVEIGSLLVTPGRRLRAQGWEGRKKLNRMALGMSFALAFVQAVNLAILFENAPASLPLVDQPGWLFRLMVACTLTAVTAVIYLAGNLITAWGVGNGFCLLVLVDGLRKVLRSLHRSTAVDDRTLLAVAVLAMITAAFLFRVRTVEVTERDETLEVPLPAFPQSVAPLGVAYFLLSLAALVPGLDGIREGRWFLPVGLAVLVPLLSLLFFSWLGTRRRLAADLPTGVLVDPEADPLLWRQLLLGTAVLAGAPLLSWAAESYAGMPLRVVVSFSFLVFAVATGLDLYAHVRFLSDHDAAPVLELDNVHLAAYLERRLTAAGIPTLVQGYQARSLFLLFGPLFKMDLLVPAERVEEAERILLPDVEEAVRAF